MIEIPYSRDPILVEREKTHGDFFLVAKTAQEIKEIIRKTPKPLNARQREALDLISTKVARILHGNPNDPDHWKDIAGYAKLGEEVCK